MVAEIRRLQKENEYLKRQCAIQKKAMSILEHGIGIVAPDSGGDGVAPDDLATAGSAGTSLNDCSDERSADHLLITGR